MLTFMYDGEALFEYGEGSTRPGQQWCVLKLKPQARVGLIRRFISYMLMKGTRYIGLGEQQLAAAIFAALAHPSMQYVEHNRETPVWRSAIDRLQAASRGSTELQMRARQAGKEQ